MLSRCVMAMISLICVLPTFAELRIPRETRTLEKSYFPFTTVENAEEWQARREEIRFRTQLAAGLYPWPERTPLNTVIHSRIERDDYAIEKVIFESLPGHYVTGNLYSPKSIVGKIPAVICPHGHWSQGRFTTADDATVKKRLSDGSERFANAAKCELQAQCVQFARLGCYAFLFDTLGNADSVQIPQHRHGPSPDGFVSAAAENQLCGFFHLQTWNGLRAVDFALALPQVDTKRIGCTGASGGGTQTMMIAGLDDRVVAAFPQVMVSTAMQGGCVCENANYLRVHQGNIDIAALVAPRPLGLTAADDWTKQLETKGYPDLRNLYSMLNVGDRLEAHFNLKFGHNMNTVARGQMIAFFQRHFNLPSDRTEERDFTYLTNEEATVWNAAHIKPTGEQTGPAHERAVIAWFAEQAKKSFAAYVTPKTPADCEAAKKALLPAWTTMLGVSMPAPKSAKWELDEKHDRGDHLLMRGDVKYDDIRTPATYFYPKSWNRDVVLWVSLRGDKPLLDEEGQAKSDVKRLLENGYAIAVPFLDDAKRHEPANSKAAADSFTHYSGFHYGYNPSLTGHRVRDVLALIAQIRDDETHPTVRLILAADETAGTVGLAASALAGERVQETIVDTAGFRFANVNDVYAAEFQPGAPKYGDLPALAAMIAPRRLRTFGEEAAKFTRVQAAFAATGKTEAFSLHTRRVGKNFLAETAEIILK